MFALLLFALIMAVLMEKGNEIVPEDSLLLGENIIDNNSFAQDGLEQDRSE